MAATKEKKTEKVKAPTETKTQQATEKAMREASEAPMGTWHSGLPGDPSLKSG